MRRTSAFQFGFPRFRGAVRNIVLLSVGIWVFLILLSAFNRPLVNLLLNYTALIPKGILQGWIWQFLTYGFVHFSPGQILTTVISVFFIGSSVEEVTGKRGFYELYLTALVGAGVLGFLLSLTGHLAGGSTLGAGPADNAILMVFYLFYRGASIYLFPLPFQIPVKWVVIGIGVIEAGYWVLSGYPLFYTVNLLGLGMGYLWHRFLYRRASMSAVIGDQVYAIRNSYHRWKRRRAGRKFQVYMRKHQQDPKQYFDEYGNFRPPDDPEKKNGGSKGGWVN